jgi:glucosyl-3-phosphoglycerate phosphatase
MSRPGAKRPSPHRSPGPQPSHPLVRVVLVRHGETWDNRAGVFQGHRGAGLSDLGAAQAAATAAYLQRVHPDARLVVRSDLQRVAETSAGLERTLAGAEVRVDPRLREIDVGSWSGKSFSQIREEDPEGFRAWQGGEDLRRGGGETFGALRRRVGSVLEAVHAELSDGGGTALLITHGGPVRVAVASVLGLPPGGERLLAPVTNCSLTVLDAPAGEALRLRAYNVVTHLGQLDGAAPAPPRGDDA